MTVGLFLLVAHFGKGFTLARNIENWVVAKAVVALGCS